MRKLLFLLILLPSLGLAQNNRYLQIAARNMASQIYYEGFALPAPDGQATLVVSFRFPNDRLVFLRNHDDSDQAAYKAAVDLTIELYRDGDLVTEKIWKKDHFATSYEASKDKNTDLQGAVSFLVASGRYAFRIRFNDLNTEREATSMLRPVTIPDFSEMAVGQAILAKSLETKDVVYEVNLTNLKGDIAFGDNAIAILPLTLPTGTDIADVVLDYSLREVDVETLEKGRRKRNRANERYARRRSRKDTAPLEEEPQMQLKGVNEVRSGTVAGTEFVGINPVTEAQISTGQLNLIVTESDPTRYLALVDLEGTILENGTYILEATLKAGDQTEESRSRITTHWRNMPFSLYDLGIAIENMRFIVDKQTIKTIEKGTQSEKLETFRTFWKERDPSAETAYNELMAEYYRRVDHAAFAYRTGAGQLANGLQTDRAKIYITHGPPADIKRDFPLKGGVQETWTYADGQTFVFAAVSSLDNFRMIEKSE